MFTHCFGVTCLLFLPSAAIALFQSTAVASPPSVTLHTSAHQRFECGNIAFIANSDTPHLALNFELNGKPGLPRRRVGGGSRLY